MTRNVAAALALFVAVALTAITLMWWWDLQRDGCERLGEAMARDWQWSAGTGCLVTTSDGGWVPSDQLMFTEFVGEFRVDASGAFPLPHPSESP